MYVYDTMLAWLQEVPCTSTVLSFIQIESQKFLENNSASVYIRKVSYNGVLMHNVLHSVMHQYQFLVVSLKLTCVDM